MKQSFNLLLSAALLVTGAFLFGCQTSTERVDAAKDNVEDAKQELQDVKKDVAEEASKVASAEEWLKFKTESDEQIRKNEVRIAELKVKMKKPGKTLDAAYAKSIETLEQKNTDLKNRIGVYENNQSNWESFKREFAHDMEELGRALQDLTIDNKN